SVHRRHGGADRRGGPAAPGGHRAGTALLRDVGGRLPEEAARGHRRAPRRRAGTELGPAPETPHRCRRSGDASAGAVPFTRQRAPGARRAAGRAPRAHGVAQRRSAARGGDRGDRSRHGGRPGMAVSATVAVAGAGLAGLSAAWELSRAGATAVVLDAGRRPGGVVVMERPGAPGAKEGFVIEGGPDGFLAA